MSLGRFAKRFKDGVKSSFGLDTMFGLSKIRRFSAPRPETCFLMGRYGKIPISGKRWAELGHVFQKRPILEPVPCDWIYGVPDHFQPYLTNDPSRYLLRSGLFLPYFSNLLGRSYAGAFQMGNVGVIEDLRLLAFRELTEDSDGRWLSDTSGGYLEYKIFLDGITCQYPSYLHPREMTNWILSLLKVGPLEEECILYHSTHLSDDEYGQMLIELWKLLRQRYPQLGEQALAERIRHAVVAAHADFLFQCQRHPILNNFIPEWSRNPAFVLRPPAGWVPSGSSYGATGSAGGVPTGSAGWVPSGSSYGATGSAGWVPSGGHANTPLPKVQADTLEELSLLTGRIIVDSCRHGFSHSDDLDLRSLIKFLPGGSAANLANVPLGREVCRLFRYKFPWYLPVVFSSFWNEGRKYWVDLDLMHRNPIPSIYFSDAEPERSLHWAGDRSKCNS